MVRGPVSKQPRQQLQALIPAFVPSAKGDACKLAVSNEAARNDLRFVLQTCIYRKTFHSLLDTAESASLSSGACATGISLVSGSGCNKPC